MTFKLMTLYTVSYEIKYTTAELSCVHSKIQQLCLIRYTLDLGDTCWDELLAAWFLQVQQILSKTTDTCLVLARSKSLMTTSTTYTCLVQQTKAQRNPCDEWIECMRKASVVISLQVFTAVEGQTEEWRRVALASISNFSCLVLRSSS